MPELSRHRSTTVPLWLLGGAVGLAIWYVAPILSGVRVTVDSGLHGLATLAASVVMALAIPRFSWRWGAVIVGAQVAAFVVTVLREIVVDSSGESLWPLGLMLLVVFGGINALAAGSASWARRAIAGD